ncbi:MAG: hypothetical protein ACYDGR_14985 [Candidatus Dormibacteria bacterium]
MKTVLPTVAFFLAASAAVTLGLSDAAASCAGPPVGLQAALATAPLVFVGTVIGTSDQDRTATVHVDEVWTGQHLPPEVILRGTPDVGAAATSVDRHYQSGHQYLFVPASAAGPPYDDNSCTMTREFAQALALYRPATVIRYAPTTPTPILPLVAAAVVALGAVAYIFTRVHGRSRSGSS